MRTRPRVALAVLLAVSPVAAACGGGSSDGAPDGMLWVERKAIGRDARGPIDVLSPEGEYLGTLPAGTPLPGTFLPGDRIAAVRKDSLDIERVTEYRIVRGGT